MREPKSVNDLLTTRLLRLSNTLGLYSSRRYRDEFDVTLPEWRVLSIIALLETTSARDVSRALATDKAWVGLTVQKLERRGYVRRVSDRQDGRRTLVSLTRQGMDVHDAIMANARRRHRRLLGALGDKDAETLIASLDRLQAEADRMLEEFDES
jgi:DNA-binding MarR family transcriptional regulator